ncbi:disease resistance protein RGA2-like isoform X2 [Quercus suber]|uniref:disease resistance protein RGA2-like isoform X2 n=1 Tax=Quercus suber TaxID=58331 RepID=UPI0032DEFCB5
MTELASSVAEKVIEKLGSLAYQEISLTLNIASDFQKLKLTMSIIQAVLLDAEEKQMQNRGLTVWLEQLKDAFHDAMDVLDEFECEDLRRQVVKTHGSTSRKMFLGDCSLRKLINSAITCSTESLSLLLYCK